MEKRPLQESVEKPSVTIRPSQQNSVDKPSMTSRPSTGVTPKK